jgi:mannose-6-phosphate isomerase-like protein (cupin superfamily)
MKYHASVTEILANIPGKITPQWPMGERFSAAIAHGSMSVELYAPIGSDPQKPHSQDELYVVAAGSGVFELNGADLAFATGDVLFVPAGMAHHFKQFSDDFKTWVVFWGPQGGEINNSLTKLS